MQGDQIERTVDHATTASTAEEAPSTAVTAATVEVVTTTERPPASSSSTIASIIPAVTRPELAPRGQKRQRDSSSKPASSSSLTKAPPPPPPPTSGSSSQPSVARIGPQPRQIELVIFSGYEIKTEYASPYPFPSSEESTSSSNTHGSSSSAVSKNSTFVSASSSSTARNRKNVVGIKSKLNPASSHGLTASTIPSRDTSAVEDSTSIKANDNNQPLSPELGLAAPPPPAPSITQALQQQAQNSESSSTVEPLTVREGESMIVDDQPTHSTIPQSPSEASDVSDEIVAALVVPPPPPPSNSRLNSPGLSPMVAPSSSEVESAARSRQSIEAQSTNPETATSLATPSLANLPLSDNLPTPQPPATVTTPTLSDPTSPHPSSSLLRGHAGRFLPKPFHETVRGRRQLAKASSSSPSSSLPRSHSRSSNKSTTSINNSNRENSIGPSGAGHSVGGARGSGGNGNGKDGLAEPVKRMWVCEGCFKYMLEPTALKRHLVSTHIAYTSLVRRFGADSHPPGKKVYQRGAHTVWEVDGAVEKLWCQNLCLFGKLFIEHKYMFFDLEGFVFYVVTDATPSRDWPLAYFSKEKLSYDDYNLACIVTFPPYRAKGWAALLIELSYEITLRQPSPSGLPGTPERPLSSTGLASYRTYWTGKVVRYLRTCFEQKTIDPIIRIEDSSPSKSSTRHHKNSSRKEKEKEARKANENNRGRELRKRIEPGSAFEEIPTDLNELARKVHLRPEDVAFVLVDSGLAQWRRTLVDTNGEAPTGKGTGTVTVMGTNGEGEDGEGVLVLCITPELVEKVALEKKVKSRGVLSMAYVLL